MTAISPGRAAAAGSRPALTAGPWGGQVINLFFAATVVLFFVGLLAFGPIA
ncbi:MAG: hypothetical protein ACT4RN_04170 [Pseudonocardia sp.]